MSEYQFTDDGGFGNEGGKTEVVAMPNSPEFLKAVDELAQSREPVAILPPPNKVKPIVPVKNNNLPKPNFESHPTFNYKPTAVPQTQVKAPPPPPVSNLPDLNSESEFKQSLVFVLNEDSRPTLKLPQNGEHLGNYEIKDLIGKGGFGAVYLAKNLSLGRDEALKLILPSAKSGCEDIEKRFVREIDIISRLEHPNIIRLYNTGTWENSIWMTMEYIQGLRLDERLSQQGQLPFPKAKNLMLQILCGLMEAHRRQIIHRDLKPANVMLSKKEGYADQAIILDFGLSKALGDSEDSQLQQLTLSSCRRIYGSPHYMAPEQFQIDPNLQLGPWTDVYSAGLIFYEMLTGNKAFSGSSLFDVAFNQCKLSVEYPDYLKNTALQVIIDKACAKNPSARYRDAGDFFDALQHVNQMSDPPEVLNGPLVHANYLDNLGYLSKTRPASLSRQTMKLQAIDIPDASETSTTEFNGNALNRFDNKTLIMVFGFFIVILLLLILILAL